MGPERDRVLLQNRRLAHFPAKFIQREVVPMGNGSRTKVPRSAIMLLAVF